MMLSNEREEFLKGRNERIGASEVPAIMGTCDFGSAMSVWEIKTGRKDPFVGNWATQRGHDLEPLVREIYEREFNVKASPKFVQYETWPTLTATLDGFTGQQVVEIKVPSAKKHEMALNGLVPTTYRDQIQAQMLCAGVDEAHYVSYDPIKEQIAVVLVKADKNRQDEILSMCKTFWELVQNNVPPVSVEVEQPELEVLFVMLKKTREQMKALESEEKTYIDKIKSLMISDKVKCGDFKAYWTTRKGSVKYADIPELKGVDLEQYRGPDTRVFTVK